MGAAFSAAALSHTTLSNGGSSFASPNISGLIKEQNATLDQKIESIDVTNLTNYERAQYRGVQVTYLENIIYILNVAYYCLIGLFLILLAVNYQTKLTLQNVFTVPLLFLYPFIAFQVEYLLYSLSTFMRALAFSQVYEPPPINDGTTYIR